MLIKRHLVQQGHTPPPPPPHTHTHITTTTQRAEVTGHCDKTANNGTCDLVHRRIGHLLSKETGGASPPP